MPQQGTIITSIQKQSSEKIHIQPASWAQQAHVCNLGKKSHLYKDAVTTLSKIMLKPYKLPHMRDFSTCQ